MVDRRLGRGLESLVSRTTEAGGQQVAEIPLDSIRPNPDQPRMVMNEATLDGLAQSIRQHGVLQPVVVQRVDGGFQLVAGERRFRASRLAGLVTIPALVISAEGSRSLELALIENIQRENLGPLEEASAFEVLVARSALTHQELADRMGKSRAAVTNTLRLLELPDSVKQMIAAGTLSAGHARALLASGSPGEIEALAALAVRQRLSVRDLERRAKSTRPSSRRGGRRAMAGIARYGDYESSLRSMYDAKVSMSRRGRGGALTFSFSSEVDGLRLIHELLEAGRLLRRESLPRPSEAADEPPGDRAPPVDSADG